MNITASNVTVMIDNMDEAIAFYQNLGLVLQQRWEDHYAMIGASGITIGLHPAHGEETGSGSASIGFMVDNIDEARSILQKNNIGFEEHQANEGHYLNFEDPWGTVLYYVLPKW